METYTHRQYWKDNFSTKVRLLLEVAYVSFQLTSNAAKEFSLFFCQIIKIKNNWKQTDDASRGTDSRKEFVSVFHYCLAAWLPGCLAFQIDCFADAVLFITRRYFNFVNPQMNKS